MLGYKFFVFVLSLGQIKDKLIYKTSVLYYMGQSKRTLAWYFRNVLNYVLSYLLRISSLFLIG